MAGDGELRANWNKALVEELAASCYSRVLIAAKGVLGGGGAYEALWPTGHTAPGSMWRGLADSLMRIAKPLPLLKTRLKGGGWVAPRSCVVWAAGGVRSDGGGGGGGGGGEEDERKQRALADVLLAEMVCAVMILANDIVCRANLLLFLVWRLGLAVLFVVVQRAEMLLYYCGLASNNRFSVSEMWLYEAGFLGLT